MTTLTQSVIGFGGETMEPNNFRTPVHYATLATMTSQPGAPMAVLNPNDPTYRRFHTAFNNGLLHPNQSVNGANYYNITTAYGKDPINIYASRVCSGNKIQ
jgi:hypothetical protein